MRSFIFSLITLAVLFGAVCADCIYVDKKVSELIEICDSLPENAEDADITQLSNKWEACRGFIGITVDRKVTDAVDDAVAFLSICINQGDTQRYAEELTKLSQTLHRLADSEGLSLDGLL